MKTLRFKIINLLSLLLFFACGEIEYIQPTGGEPQGGDIPELTGQEFTYHANDLPVLYFDVVLQENGRMNAVGAPVPLLADLRASQEVALYKFRDDTTLTQQSGVFNQAYFSEMGIPEANLQNVFLELLGAELTEVKVRAVGLNAQNEVDWSINGEVQKFYIQMKWGNNFSSSLEAGNLADGTDLNYVLKDTYTAQINSSNSNNRRLVEIFLLAIDFFWQRQDVYFLAEGWTTLDYGTKLRYYFTITGDIKFSMHLRENS